jgi:hypothetical protein
MAEIVIREELARRLRDAARQRNLPVEQFIESMLDRLGPWGSDAGEPPSPDSLAALAESARKANIAVERDDVSVRSREMLDDERADHLMRWMDQRGDGGDG